jgi:hypothetical protein
MNATFAIPAATLLAELDQLLALGERSGATAALIFMHASRRSPALPLPFEKLEMRVTRDQPFVDRYGAWGWRRSPPPGPGWRVHEFDHRERLTCWIRRSPPTTESSS